ncbi:MAG: ABC transporter permease [Acidobacteriota bacterium]
MLLENLRIALRSILANPMRSFLTTLGIIIGVAAVIGVVSIVQGLNFWIAGQLQGVGATYIRVDPRQDPTDPDLVGRGVTLTYEDGFALLERVPELEAFTPIAFRSDRVRRRDRTSTPFILGVGSSFQEVTNTWVERGRFLTAIDEHSNARVCVIGDKVAEDLELGVDPLGAEITIGANVFTVVGVMEKLGQILGANRDSLVVIPFTTAREMYGEESVKQFFRLDFKARSADAVARAKDLMSEILRRRHGLTGTMANDFEVTLQEELLETTSSILGAVTKVVGAVVGIALLVGGIGIMNIMLVTVRERTREIGIRKAVGARRADVLVQFLIEAVTLSALGGAIGIGGGWGLGAIGASAIPGFPSAHVPLWAILLGFGFATAVGVFFGVYPAAKAASVDPIEALRYE